MNNEQSYAVFGLGRYGRAIAKELVDNGMEVLAVDMDETIVNEAIAEIPFCKCADITDAEVIKQLGIANVDVVAIVQDKSVSITIDPEMNLEKSMKLIVIANKTKLSKMNPRS